MFWLVISWLDCLKFIYNEGLGCIYIKAVFCTCTIDRKREREAGMEKAWKLRKGLCFTGEICEIFDGSSVLRDSI